MIKTPLSTVIGGAFWTPGATVINGAKLSFETVMKKLFANGEQGFWYDPSDMGTMFQDAAGTVPVTGVGQPVGLIRDKSGRNNHAYQTASASRPILRQNTTTGAYYLEFDGSDDFLQTSSVDFTATDKVSLFVGLRKYQEVGINAILFELSTITGSANKGSFRLLAPSTSSQLAFRSCGSFDSDSFTNNAVYASQNPLVVSALAQISTDINIMKVNGVSVSTSMQDQGTGNYGNYPLYIGRRGGVSLSFNGHIYGLIGIGKLASDNETAAIEKELAKRTGVTLNV